MPSPRPVACGQTTPDSAAGYTRHRLRHEPVCQACYDARNRYERQHRYQRNTYQGRPPTPTEVALVRALASTLSPRQLAFAFDLSRWAVLRILTNAITTA